MRILGIVWEDAHLSLDSVCNWADLIYISRVNKLNIKYLLATLCTMFISKVIGILCLKRDGTRAETRFGLSEKRTRPFKSAGPSVQSTTGSRGVRISGSNAAYTKFWTSVKHRLGTGYPLHSPVSLSLPLPVRHRVPSRFNWTLTLVCWAFAHLIWHIFCATILYIDLSVSSSPSTSFHHHHHHNNNNNNNLHCRLCRHHHDLCSVRSIRPVRMISKTDGVSCFFTIFSEDFSKHFVNFWSFHYMNFQFATWPSMNRK
jgi:hypothetical protein